MKSLLSTVSLEEQNPSQRPSAIAIGKRASFWNFARADYQASYINHQTTFLNTEDLPLWQNFGLQVQIDGSLYNDCLQVKNDPMHCRSVAELVSHTLLWLVLRVTNYLAVDAVDAPMMRQARWLQLTGQLEAWHAHLPQTFQPCAQMRHPVQQASADNAGSTNLDEVFFSIDVCAAALQLYHFARILLLLHCPLDPHAHRDTGPERIRHAHQIIAIALGRPQPAVRVEMLLPLYVAGCCLDSDEERYVVLQLLQAIEKDTGCSTEKRCAMLQAEWNWTVERH